MHPIVLLLLWVTALPAVGASAYLLVMTLLSGELPALPISTRRMRFDVIIPAHDEAAVIGRVLRSVRSIDWPQDQFRVIVIADNCTDATAQIAAAEGACVIERRDPERRGKGYALELAFRASRADDSADAVVVIDADAEVSPNLLEAFARRMERGAMAVQAHYGVSNASVSWRTRLLSIAKASFHIVRSRARERLGVSCGIRGNGWAVTHRLLEEVPFRAFSLTEDLEYGIALGLAGHRVHFAEEAHSDAEMVSSGKDAGRQRQRWERGRFALIRAKTAQLLRCAIRRRSLVCLDLACDLLVLPLSYVVLNVAALMILAWCASRWDPAVRSWLWPGWGCLVAIALYVLRGWQLSGSGARGLLDLARAPFFLLWKILVVVRGQRSTEWARTKREQL